MEKRSQHPPLSDAPGEPRSPAAGAQLPGAGAPKLKSLTAGRHFNSRGQR